MNLKNFFSNMAKAYLVVGALSASSLVSAENGCAPACAPVCREAPKCGVAYNPCYERPGNGCETFMDSLGFRAEFLYWRASADELALGVEQTITPITADKLTAIDEAYVKRPGFSFNPGFRLGITHFNPCACWDLALNWTHYHNKSSVNGDSEDLGLLTSGDEILVVPTTPYTVFIPYWEAGLNMIPDQARGQWTFDADWIDLELGHKYYVSSNFILRPHLGLRAARINQGFHVESYADRGLVGEGTLTDDGGVFGASNHYESTVKAKNDFLSVGPRLGLNMELDLGCGFSVVGEVAGSMLLGRAKKHASEEFDGILYGEEDDDSATIFPVDYSLGNTF